MANSNYGSLDETNITVAYRTGDKTPEHEASLHVGDENKQGTWKSVTLCGKFETDPRSPPLKRSDIGPDDTNSDNSSYTQHCHDNGNATPGLDKRARMKLVIASVLCLTFMIAEVVGGVLANSLAIATDAAHLLTDFASFMISLFAIYLASRPATKSMSFGWHRAEVMGALISVLLIWVVTGVLVKMAIERVISGDYEIDAKIMLIISSLGIVFNFIMLVTLHDTHGHSHGGGSHGHSHNIFGSGGKKQVDTKVPKPKTNGVPGVMVAHNNSQNDDQVALLEDGLATDTEGTEKDKAQNINVRAAYVHVLGDLVQSAGVFVAALIIYFKPEYKLADPICTFLFSVLVLVTTVNILRDTLNVLMEGAPRGVSFTDVKYELCQITGVQELHNLRLWSLTTTRSAVAVHLAIVDGADQHLILAQAGDILREKFGINECTIQTEKFVDEMKDCMQCQDPQD